MMGQPDFFFHDPKKSDWEMLDLSFIEFTEMLEWAFGKGWTAFPKNQLGQRWNKVHGKKHFQIKGTDDVGITMVKIRDAWAGRK